MNEDKEYMIENLSLMNKDSPCILNYKDSCYKVSRKYSLTDNTLTLEPLQDWTQQGMSVMEILSILQDIFLSIENVLVEVSNKTLSILSIREDTYLGTNSEACMIYIG